jgi:nucleotide-binding universal stress UspA family protein
MTGRTPTRRILVPLDGSELATVAIPWARALATPETEIVLFRVVPEPAPLIELAGTSRYPAARILSHRIDDATEYLTDVAGTLGDAAQRVSTGVVAGDAPDAILDAAEEHKADLIIMATHGHGFMGRVLIGSVADRVARAATMPVLLIHPVRGAGAARVDDAVAVARIVVPLDGSDRARQALPVARSLAQQLAVPIHLVRVLPTAKEIAAQRASRDDAYYAEQTTAITDALAEEARAVAAEGITTTSETIVGAPAEAIVDGTREGDLIVMTSHGLGGVRRWLLGSVAERLIRTSAAPVVLVPVAERQRLTA